ncbi:hypothetical protein [Nioella aestuarii]|uniref:VHL beta domain-containing protein n=1 Tax=Nioella aestuarii TaxID=1662864 RepID=UPI003D7F6635
MIRFPLILASAVLAVSSVTATAQQGYSWQHYAQPSSDPFQPLVTLVYGVPETDDIQFFASCQIGAGMPYALVQIAADTAGLPNGAAVSMSFTDGAGAGTILDGSIIGVNAEFGITGVELALELEDGLFNLMRARDVLSYAIPGGQGFEIGTAGVAGPMDQFLTTCADPVAGAAPVTGGELPPPAPDAHGCEMLGQVLSLNGNQPQQITLTNMTDGYRGVVWIDYNGDFVDMGAMNAGESMTIDSYVTHPFMITDGPGNCLEVMVTTGGQSSFAITAPGQFFGNE